MGCKVKYAHILQDKPIKWLQNKNILSHLLRKIYWRYENGPPSENDPPHCFGPIRSSTGCMESLFMIYSTKHISCMHKNINEKERERWWVAGDMFMSCLCAWAKTESGKGKKQTNKACLLNWWPHVSVAHASVASQTSGPSHTIKFCRSLMCYIWTYSAI